MTSTSVPSVLQAEVATRAILFSDVVGSTELRSRLGEASADRLRGDHDKLIGEAIAAHGGTVLRWTGDGVKATFSSASASVAAAMAIHRAVRAYGRRRDSVAAFQVRIGLSVGEVSSADGDHHGVAVVEAARLEALASAGETLATDLVERLGGRRTEASFEAVGQRTLKGLDQPVAVVRVVDAAPDVAAVPLPRLLTIDRRFPLVGRARPIAHIDRRWGEVVAGGVATVLITGAPGMGKSRLLAHAARRAHEAGALVIAGTCDSDLSVPYQPFATAFSDPLLVDDVLRAAVSNRAGPLGPLFPGGRLDRSDDQGPAARFELFEAVAALLRRLANERPVVLVLEDLQWATPPTLLLLRHLVQRLESGRVLILGTYRDEELGRDSALRELIGEIHSVATADKWELTPLDEGDVTELIAAMVPDAPDAHITGFARRVRDDSAGNAFFVCELLEHLATSGQLERLVIGGEAGAMLPIPDTVRDVVGQRLARLRDDTDEVLAIAATIGLSFELDLISRASGRALDDVLEQLEHIARAGIVHEVGVGRYSFSHAIVRATLLDRLSATRRALVHRRIAEAIEAIGGERHDELSHHWMSAGDETSSYTHLELAARRDLSALAYESAADRFCSVLEFTERAPSAPLLLQARACLGVGAARRALGHGDFMPMIERTGRLARKLHDPDLMASAAVATTFPGGFFVAAGRTEDGPIELCEDAIALLDPGDPRSPRIMANLAAHLTFHPDRQRRIELVGRALELATEHGDPDVIGVVLAAEFISLWDPMTRGRRAEIARQISRMGRASGEADLAFMGGYFEAFCAAENGDVSDAKKRLAALETVAEHSRNFYFRFLRDRLALSLAIFTGAPDQQPAIDELAARYADSHADTAGTWSIQTGVLAKQEGRFGGFADYLAHTAATSQVSGNWTAATGLAMLVNGDRGGAEAMFDRCASPPLDYLWLVTQQSIAELGAALGRVDRCEALFDELLPHRGVLGIASSGAACYGLVSTTLGQLAAAVGRRELAYELLSEAAGQADAIGAAAEASVARRHLAAL